MERRLFDDLVLSRTGGGHTRAGAMPFSVVIHGAALAVLLALSVAVRDEPPTPRGPIIQLPAGPRASAHGDPSPPRRTPTRRTPTTPTLDAVRTVLPESEALPLDDEPSEPGPDDGSNCVGCAPTGTGPVGDSIGSDPSGTGPATPERVPVRVGGRLEAPRKTHHVDPVYPGLARAAHVSGTVILECVIGRDGRVQSVTVLRGHPLLEAAAAGAVRQWIYRPTLLNGVPVDVVMTVTVRFSL